MSHPAWTCDDCGTLVPPDDTTHHLKCQRRLAREEKRKTYVKRSTRMRRLVCFFRGHRAWAFNHRWEPWCMRCGVDLP